MLRPTLALGIAALIAMAPYAASIADSRVPFALEVREPLAVPEPTAVRATIVPPEGMKLTSIYVTASSISRHLRIVASSSKTRW